MHSKTKNLTDNIFTWGRKMYTISKKTKMNIERIVGMPIEKIITMDTKEERSWIEKRNNSKLAFSKKTQVWNYWSR